MMLTHVFFWKLNRMLIASSYAHMIKVYGFPNDVHWCSMACMMIIDVFSEILTFRTPYWGSVLVTLLRSRKNPSRTHTRKPLFSFGIHYISYPVLGFILGDISANAPQSQHNTHQKTFISCWILCASSPALILREPETARASASLVGVGWPHSAFLQKVIWFWCARRFTLRGSQKSASLSLFVLIDWFNYN